PDDRNDRDVDLGEDVDRRPRDGEHAPDGDQQRHHDERVRPAERETDDPHRSTYGPALVMHAARSTQLPCPWSPIAAAARLIQISGVGPRSLRARAEAA